MGTPALGRGSTLEVSDDGVTYYAVAGVVDCNLNFNVETVDVTDHDSGGSREFIANRDNWTLDASLVYEDDDTNGQTRIITNAMAKTKTYLRYRPRGSGSGKPQYVGQAYFNALPINSPNDDAGRMNVTAQGTGALTKSNQ